MSNRFQEATQRLNIILLWSALAGLLTGLVGAVFRFLVGYGFQHRALWIQGLKSHGWIAAVVSVLVSAGLVQIGFWLMRRYAPDTGGSGIPQIEGLLEGHFPLLWQRAWF